MKTCCLCLHATFKKPAGGVDVKAKDAAPDMRGVSWCRLVGAHVTFNPTAVRSCDRFLPAPNQVQREAAQMQLGGAFSFIPRKTPC